MKKLNTQFTGYKRTL